MSRDFQIIQLDLDPEAFGEFAALLARLARGAPWPSDLGEAIATPYWDAV